MDHWRRPAAKHISSLCPAIWFWSEPGFAEVLVGGGEQAPDRVRASCFGCWLELWRVRSPEIGSASPVDPLPSAAPMAALAHLFAWQQRR